MDREKVILKHIDKRGAGLEIGPGPFPMAPKSAGYNVEILDIKDREALVTRQEEQGLTGEAIEEVDYLWRGESFAELTGKPKHYDWIIASHVIEHTPDLIGFLLDCDSVLRNDGVLSLVVPDQRDCFDHFRPLTGLARIIDAHLHRQPVHSAGTAVEFLLNVVSKDGLITWERNSPGEYRFMHSLEQAVEHLNLPFEERWKHDYHAWCFVPHSFRVIINDLYDVGLIPFREIAFRTPGGGEFFMTLGRTGGPPKPSRLEMLRRMQDEIRAGLDPPLYEPREGIPE